jgi:hypothetical protein
MRSAESKANKVLETVVVFGVGVPIVGLLMGGIYSVPVMSLCKGHEPYLSALLSFGLGMTNLVLDTLPEPRFSFRSERGVFRSCCCYSFVVCTATSMTTSNASASFTPSH